MRKRKGPCYGPAPFRALLKSTTITLLESRCSRFAFASRTLPSRTFVQRAAPAIEANPTTPSVPILLSIFLVSTNVTSVKGVENLAGKRRGYDLGLHPYECNCRPYLTIWLFNISLLFLSITGLAKSADVLIFRSHIKRREPRSGLSSIFGLLTK